MLGSLAGSALFPTQLPPGPKISDTRTTTSAVGGPVALVFGTAAVAGTVMDLGPLIQSSVKSGGGKGGPQQTTYNYYQTIAIGLCERVDDDAEDSVGAIQGLSRIWENGAIVYDIRPQLQADTALNQAAETDVEYANRLTASAVYAETFVLHTGDELQLADPTLEIIHGAPNTPPFRGLAYIVYPNRALTIAQGLRHPNFQFEVFQTGTGECTTTSETSTTVLYPWATGSGAQDPSDPRNLNTFQIQDFDATLGPPGNPYFTGDYGNWTTTQFPTASDAAELLTFFYGASMQIIGYQCTFGADNPENKMTFHTGGDQVSGQESLFPDPQVLWLCYWFNLPTPPTDYLAGSVINYAHLPDKVYWQDGSESATVYWSSGPPYVEGTGDPGTIIPPYNKAIGAPTTFPFDGTNLIWSQYSYSASVVVTRNPAPPPDPCFALPPSAVTGFSIQPDGKLVKCGPWTRTDSSSGNIYKVLQIYNRGGSPTGVATIEYYPLNPCLAPGDPNFDNEAFWTAAYDDAVARGWMPSGLSYQATDVSGDAYPNFQTFIYSNELTICDGSGGGASIGSIIAAVCKRSGLTQIDVKDLNDSFVDGYAIASVCTGSSIITPLRSIGFFDCVETDGEIKFSTRGKDSVATFTTDDFGCYDASQGIDGQDQSDSTGASTCPPSITTSRSQDEDLPRSIRFHYIAVSRDYEDGEQDSQFRLNTAATNDVDITVPVCLSDTQALQCAQVLWADSWTARSAYEISVDQSKLEIDVADCIDVPVDGFVQRMRIANDTNSSMVLRKLSLVQDDADSFVSFAVAQPPMRQPQQLTFIGPSSYEPMDLPCLQDADSDPGFYVAAQRADGIGNGWKGTSIFKSLDSGVSFTVQFSLLIEATMGTLASAIAKSDYHTWDDFTVITVNVPSSAYTFESMTDDAVLAGGNAAAMGADGRWEIVQFAIATQMTATQWQLSRLLRGRRGTEHLIGTSRFGDSFVIVSTGDLGRVILQTTEIGASRVYKGVSIGASFSSGTDETFTGHAQALVPFSPVLPTAVRLTDDGILIGWIRRSRLGRTLMSGVDIPLGETIEQFQIDILDPISPASPEVVMRTLTATGAEFIEYTRADQIADFGSGALDSIRVAIYQMSSVVGRGTPCLANISVT